MSVDGSSHGTLGNIYSPFGLLGLARECDLTTVGWAPLLGDSTNIQGTHFCHMVLCRTYSTNIQTRPFCKCVRQPTSNILESGRLSLRTLPNILECTR